jgi:hypothetical protein
MPTSNGAGAPLAPMCPFESAFCPPASMSYHGTLKELDKITLVIVSPVWLYVRFALSYRDVEDLLPERGLESLTQQCADGS